MIEVEALTVSYGDVPALSDVNFRIPAGQFVLITGRSGCGKSTLARVLSGLIPHAIRSRMTGRVTIAGVNTVEHALPQLARRAGIVLQCPAAQLFHLTVGDEVAFGPRNLGLPDPMVRQRVLWATDAVGIGHLSTRQPAALSVGEQQRVAIAAVLAMQPEILILDEPTASLDVRGTRQVLRILRKLNKELGITVILFEHRLKTTAPLADRILVMDGGRLVVDSTRQRLLQDADLCLAHGLHLHEDCSPFHAGGEDTSCDFEAASFDPLLRLENVVAGYQRRDVLKGSNLVIRKGEFAALVGNNGAGKSTLGLVAAGLLKPRKGDVRFQGVRRPRPGRDVALLFQDPPDQIFTDSVFEEIAFGPRNFHTFDPERHREILAIADLLEIAGCCPSRLSVGQQQRTVLAACIATRPRLLILDEPTLGQDWAHLHQLMEFVASLNKKGMTILLISHDRELVCRYARRVIEMHDGHIVHDSRPDPVARNTISAEMP